MPPRPKQPSVLPADEPRRSSRTRTRPQPKTVVDVTAVLVAHDGARWLPEALHALAASTCQPRQVVCVDTGSVDGSAELLRASFPHVLELPAATGFGAAVAAALATVAPTEWVWLLHDDLAIEPGTLQALLDHAQTSPSAALLGPKVRDWQDPRYLVEVGLTVDGAGHRETGLEHREYDQGQHDAVRQVLAVGTAGALVRRSVWDAVGGLDPQLPVFRDDVDLGWKVNAAGHQVVVVPQARVRHARAATTGHRETPAAPGRASGTDRRHALWVMLAHATALRVLLLVPWLVLATALHSLGLLLTRQGGAAADEWRALLGVLGHPAQLHAARRARAAQRTLGHRELRHLFASRAVRLRARAAALGDWLSGGAPVASGIGALGDPGPESGDLDELPAGGPGLVGSLLRRPGFLLFLGLSAVALLAERSLLAVGGGPLYGGALLTAPAGARDLWASYGASWHDVSVGTHAAAAPQTAAIALLSTLLLGKPWLAVDVLLLGAVPLSGLTAYLAASRLVRHLYLRLWAAITWALLPVVTGAVAAGRLDVAAAQVALPLLVLSTGRVLTSPPSARRWWRMWGLGLGLGLLCAFVPLLWPVAALVLVVGAAVNLGVTGGRPRAYRALVVAAVPFLVLFPWSVSALAHPSLFVVGQQPADLRVPAWHLLALSPGGPGVPPAWVFGGLLLAGLGGTVRRAYRRLALGAWGVALLGFAAAQVLARLQVQGRPAWPGVPLQVAGIAVLVAALVAGNGVRARLTGHSFGWRQLVAGLVALTAALAPVLAAVAWVARGADGPLRRDTLALLPPFAAAELQSSPGLRALALSPLRDGRVAYDVYDGTPTGLVDTGLRPDAAQRASLDRVVADLVTPRGSDAAAALSTRAVRYVVVGRGQGPRRDALVAALDAQVGLVRRTTGDVELWRVVAPTARLMLLSPPLSAPALAGDRAPAADLLRGAPPVLLDAGPEAADTTIPAGQAGRVLVLADARDPGWHATLDGHRLAPAQAWGWAQAFTVPAAGGRLRLWHSQATRTTELVTEAGLLLAVGVLAVPAARRRRGLEDDVEDDEGTVDDVTRLVP